MEDKSYYETLGVPPDASHHRIREAFMKLAEKYQADRGTFPAAGWYFDRAKTAYDAVSDYDYRCRYNADRGLPEPPEPEDPRSVGWIEGLASFIPSYWWIFAVMFVAAMGAAARTYSWQILCENVRSWC